MKAPEFDLMENNSSKKGRRLQEWKIIGIAPLENDGMENDSPGKWQKITGLINVGKCNTGKWLPWKIMPPENDRIY